MLASSPVALPSLSISHAGGAYPRATRSCLVHTLSARTGELAGLGRSRDECASRSPDMPAILPILATYYNEPNRASATASSENTNRLAHQLLSSLARPVRVGGRPGFEPVPA